MERYIYLGYVAKSPLKQYLGKYQVFDLKEELVLYFNKAKARKYKMLNKEAYYLTQECYEGMIISRWKTYKNKGYKKLREWLLLPSL